MLFFSAFFFTSVLPLLFLEIRSLTNKYSEMGWAVVVPEAVAALVAEEEVDLEVGQVAVEVLELEEV